MNAKAVVSNQDLIEDLFGLDDSLTNDLPKESIVKNKEYYIEQANILMSDITVDNYYEYLLIIINKYKNLDEEKKSNILKIMNVSIPKERVVVVSKKKNKKNKLNMCDDY